MRRTIRRSGVLPAFASFLLFTVSGCSDEPSSVSLTQSFSKAPRQTLLPRPNPLQTYIQDTWTGGDPDDVGGSIYPHIKIYGHSYPNLAGDQDNADFIVTHFDMYTWGGSIIGTTHESLNPDMLWLHEPGNIPHIRTGWDSLQVESWIANPTENPMGYDWGDLLLYYESNTSTWVSDLLGLSFFPGWNPADDTDGDGCIEPGEGNNGMPSDPDKLAQCRWDARVLFRISWGKYWMRADPSSPAYIDFTADEGKGQWDTGSEGFHFDSAAFQLASLDQDSTHTYLGYDERSPDWPYIEDKIAFTPAVMADIETHTGGPTVALTNMNDGLYLCANTVQKGYALTYLENIFMETWITNTSNVYVQRRDRFLDCPYQDYLLAGKGLVFTCRDTKERAKLFSLTMFYLVNHQLAFYYYTINGHNGNNAATNQWNPWVEYEVGQPQVNSFGYQDFQGNTGTDRFFVYQDTPEYQVLGREFLRSDGKEVLVLVKLMDSSQIDGQDPDVIDLPANYKRVEADFSTGKTIHEVTLVNNEGVILLRHPGGGPGGN